ncbi:hypothetical protein [Sulfitobacter sp. SH22]|uniref:hypothetical protein n=1 Tax=Sulfitobacter sp. SH22 TaxID=3421172 RepID=UPI003F4FA296
MKSTDIQYTPLLACLRTMSQNQPTNERPQKFATEPVRIILSAAARRENQPFEHVAARFISQIYRSRDKDETALAVLALVVVLSQILLEFECGHRPDITMLRAQQTAEMR